MNTELVSNTQVLDAYILRWQVGGGVVLGVGIICLAIAIVFSIYTWKNRKTLEENTICGCIITIVMSGILFMFLSPIGTYNLLSAKAHALEDMNICHNLNTMFEGEKQK
jgi:hypothetical protein